MHYWNFHSSSILKKIFSLEHSKSNCDFAEFLAQLCISFLITDMKTMFESLKTFPLFCGYCFVLAFLQDLISFSKLKRDLGQPPTKQNPQSDAMVFKPDFSDLFFSLIFLARRELICNLRKTIFIKAKINLDWTLSRKSIFVWNLSLPSPNHTRTYTILWVPIQNCNHLNLIYDWGRRNEEKQTENQNCYYSRAVKCQ